jgi:hypothetical protein
VGEEPQGRTNALEAALGIDPDIEGSGFPSKLAFMDTARAEGLRAAFA